MTRLPTARELLDTCRSLPELWTAIVTDGVINLTPTLAEKADIAQNAIHLFKALHGADAIAKVAVVTAVETVNPDMPATIDAACLSKMAQRGQIQGALVDGQLAKITSRRYA